ncbi:MAG: dTDP-glucose 4,6-dehydratase [Bacteroidota bacterium]
MKNILITGGAGFIGSNFVRFLLEQNEEYVVVNFDKLTYAGNLENLEDLEGHPRYRFVKGDICDRPPVESIIKEYPIDAIVNFAAESHVDRSILGPAVFIETNVVGTNTLLEVTKDFGLERFMQISTDEVYGSLGAAGKFTERHPLHPNSPYSASKASADLLVQAYYHTFGLPVVIARSSNNYGPYQFPEKLMPLMIVNALANRSLPVYGDGQHVRDWLYVKDHCAALELILQSGRPGEIYNIGGDNEKKNIEVVKIILQHLGKPESLIEHVKDRPGHDRRYAIDAAKIKEELAWRPSHTFEEGLEQTIDWYVTHQGWWKRVTGGDYRAYYRKMYEER